MIFQVGKIFIVLHFLWHWASVFAVSSEGPISSICIQQARGTEPDTHRKKWLHVKYYFTWLYKVSQIWLSYVSHTDYDYVTSR